jgi:hypothetical protein
MKGSRVGLNILEKGLRVIFWLGLLGLLTAILAEATGFVLKHAALMGGIFTVLLFLMSDTGPSRASRS